MYTHIDWCGDHKLFWGSGPYLHNHCSTRRQWTAGASHKLVYFDWSKARQMEAVCIEEVQSASEIDGKALPLLYKAVYITWWTQTCYSKFRNSLGLFFEAYLTCRKGLFMLLLPCLVHWNWEPDKQNSYQDWLRRNQLSGVEAKAESADSPGFDPS